MKPNTQNFGGLLELEKDERDLTVGQLFSLPDLKDIPDEFDVSEPLVIKDQQADDFCFAFATSSISEDQEAVELSPFFQAYATKTIVQNNDKTWGADLRSAALSAVNVGSLESSLTDVGITVDRDVVLDPKTWSADQMANAETHKKASFAMVVGQYDHFDNIRATMWYFKDNKKSVLVGLTWCAEWLSANAGIIDFMGQPISGHAFKIFGVAKRFGQLFLKAQLSSGTGVGEGGIFYISREVMNSGKPFGAIVFTDYSKDTLQQHQDANIKVDVNVIIKTILFVIDTLQNYFRKIKS